MNLFSMDGVVLLQNSCVWLLQKGNKEWIQLINHQEENVQNYYNIYLYD